MQGWDRTGQRPSTYRTCPVLGGLCSRRRPEPCLHPLMSRVPFIPRNHLISSDGLAHCWERTSKLIIASEALASGAGHQRAATSSKCGLPKAFKRTFTGVRMLRGVCVIKMELFKTERIWLTYNGRCHGSQPWLKIWAFEPGFWSHWWKLICWPAVKCIHTHLEPLGLVTGF